MKATTLADIGTADTPEASRPVKHFILSGRRHWVVRVRGDGNCFFRSVSKACTTAMIKVTWDYKEPLANE